MDTPETFTNADSDLKIVKVESIVEGMNPFGTEAFDCQHFDTTKFSSELQDNIKKEGYKRMERLSLELEVLRNLMLTHLNYYPTYQLNKYVRLILDLPFKEKNTLSKMEIKEMKRILATKTFTTGQIGFGITNLEEVLGTVDSTWSPHEKLTIIAWNINKVSRHFKRKITISSGSVLKRQNTTNQGSYLVDSLGNLMCDDSFRRASFNRMKNTFVRLDQLPKSTSKTISKNRSKRCAARALIKESLTVVDSLKNFRVPCLNSSYGCPFILSPKMLGSHTDKCSYPPIKNGEINSSINISKGPRSRFMAFCRTLELTNNTTLLYKLVSGGVKIKVQHKYMQNVWFKLEIYDANYRLISKICASTSTMIHHVSLPKNLCEDVIIYTIKLPITQPILTKNKRTRRQTPL